MPRSDFYHTASNILSAPARGVAKLDIQSRMARLPPWATRFTGYRYTNASTAPPAYALYLWPFLGAFCGIAVLQAIFGHTAYFEGRHVPPIIASFGASAILCYGSIEAPFAQPRALMGGHFLSAFIGVCISKIFNVGFSYDSNNLQWLAASLATAISLVVMQATKTTHPPAGATALLPCVESAVRGLGWYYLPVILLSSVVVLVTALLFNNTQRQYPKFWISPSTPSDPTLPPPSTAYRESPDLKPWLKRRSSSAPPQLPDEFDDDEKYRSDSLDSDSSCGSGSDKSGNTQVILYMPGKTRWTRNEDKTLMRGIKEGKSIDEIAQEFPGRTPAAVYQRSYMVPDLTEKQR